ncbi:MAG: hypothetical protein IJ524_06945 [Bacteroidales bacterium]|nr:hypothetical protein [Bacteroidales bacterium]
MNTHSKSRLMAFGLLMAFFVAAMLLTSCHKDDPDPQPEQPSGQTVTLASTTWEALEEGPYTYNYSGVDIEMQIRMNMVLDLFDQENGELFVDLNVEVPAVPAADQHQTFTESCTYTFDGTSLVLTSKDADATEGDDGTLTYHPETNTFTMPIDDSDIEEMLGKTELTFHQTRGGAQ